MAKTKPKPEKPCVPPYIRTIGGEKFTVVWSGAKPLESAPQCASSLQRSGLLCKFWNDE
jgi:hypothetical protein